MVAAVSLVRRAISIDARCANELGSERSGLAELGKKIAYKIHVGRREQNDTAGGVRLGDLNDENVPPLKGISGAALARIRQIDLIWYRAGKVEAVFEVENTTGITEALIRASNIPYPSKRFVVLPDERADLMLRKLAEPAFGERFKQDGWELLYYAPLDVFYDANHRKAAIDELEFQKIVSYPAAVDNEGRAKLFPD